MSRPRAAVDVGTNSVRLLVVDGDGARVLRELTITRLGQDVDATGRLQPEALERTIDTIARYAGIWRDHGVEDAVLGGVVTVEGSRLDAQRLGQPAHREPGQAVLVDQLERAVPDQLPAQQRGPWSAHRDVLSLHNLTASG